MKRILSLTLSLAMLTLVFSSVLARPANDGQRLYPMQVDLQPLTGAQTTDSRADTVFLFGGAGSGSEYGAPGTDGRGFTFDTIGGSADCGWVGNDKTAQPDTYWHIEVPTGLGSVTDMSGSLPFDGGDLTNDFAMHCGRWAVCGWSSVDGYGNNWDQHLRATCGDFATSANLNFNYIADFEGDVWDYFQVYIETYTGGVLALQEIYANHVYNEGTLLNVDLTVLATDFPVDSYGDFILRFSSDGAWSDEDGLLITDVGACWADNFILTKNGGEVWRNDLETGVVPATLIPEYPVGAGDKSTLYNNLYTEDVCSLNQSYAWAFFDLGTTNPDYPINVIQYGPPYLDNDILSPVLTMKHQANNPVGTPLAGLGVDTQVNLDFWVYADIPSDALIYYSWALASYTTELGCLGVYKNDNFVYYGDNKQWGIHHEDQDATVAVAASAQGGTVTGISIALNCVDMCPFWCDTNGSGENHTPGPFLDVVRLSLVEASSVAWSITTLHLLQDNFPEVAADGHGGAAGKVRIDAANNVEPIISPTVVIGDSAIIELNMDGHGGIKESFSSAAGEIRPELWMYFQVVAGPHAGMLNASMGDADNSDGIFSPYEGTVADVVGGEPDWGIVRCDFGYYQGNPQPGKYAFDLADNYFTAGDVIHYFFFARADDGFSENRPEWAQSTTLNLRSFWTQRCLPTAGNLVLFCDDWNGTHFWWSEAFQYNGYAGYDTYSTQAPSSGQENGLAGRATEADISQYYCIVWDSGNLQDYAVCSLGSNDKTEDDVLLDNYLSNATHPTALWLFGDKVANDLGDGSGFLADVLGADLISANDYGFVTGVLVPKVSAVDAALSYLGGDPNFWVDGGCPSIEEFALVAVNPSATMATVSHEWEVVSSTEVAGIKNLDPDGNGSGVNAQGFANPVIFHPYSYYQVWDAGYALSAGKDYARLQVGHVMELLLNCGPDVTPDAVDDAIPAYTKLEGNFPNPFNPKTAIRFSLSSSEHVSLAVYDISGRLVKELVNGQMAVGNHEIIWDGKSNTGSKAASGVYFYKMSAGDYSATDKMVMLK
jgi:hypothetical protein